MAPDQPQNDDRPPITAEMFNSILHCEDCEPLPTHDDDRFDDDTIGWCPECTDNPDYGGGSEDCPVCGGRGIV